MNRAILFLGLLAYVLGLTQDARAAIAELGQFDPSNAGGLCSIGFDHTTRNLWVYQCSGSDVQRYSSDGTFLQSISRPGESANDVDVEFALDGFILDTTFVPAGTLLFINGETGPAEVYAVDTDAGTVIDTLNSSFGNSHVVGGAYHPTRETLFLLQDQVPGSADDNKVAEINAVTGNVLNFFQTTGTFDVNFGDIEVCASTGNLLLVSSIETSIGEFTPTGDLVQAHALPSGVVSLSGIALDEALGEAWVSGAGGLVWRLGGVPCAAQTIPALPNWTLGLLTASLPTSLWAFRKWKGATNSHQA